MARAHLTGCKCENVLSGMHAGRERAFAKLQTCKLKIIRETCFHSCATTFTFTLAWLMFVFDSPRSRMRTGSTQTCPFDLLHTFQLGTFGFFQLNISPFCKHGWTPTQIYEISSKLHPVIQSVQRCHEKNASPLWGCFKSRRLCHRQLSSRPGLFKGREYLHYWFKWHQMSTSTPIRDRTGHVCRFGTF